MLSMFDSIWAGFALVWLAALAVIGAAGILRRLTTWSRFRRDARALARDIAALEAGGDLLGRRPHVP
jgi:hypothetical protein